MKDVMTWIAAVPTLVGLGLALGLNPVLYGATADTLARGVRVKSRLTWLLSGLMSGATALVLVLHGLNPARLVSRVEHRASAVVKDWAVDLSVGVVLLVVAVALAVWLRLAPSRSGAADPPPAAKSTAASDSRPAALVMLGATPAIVGFTTLPIAYLTGRTVVGVGHEWPLRLLAYAVFLAALVSPFVLLAWIWSRFPKTTKKVTALYDRMLKWDSRLVTVYVLAIIGALLVGFSLFVHR